jgi:hypothetical protein
MKIKIKPDENIAKEFKSGLGNGLPLPNNKWFLEKINEIENTVS